jgi:hypothetical protein
VGLSYPRTSCASATRGLDTGPHPVSQEQLRAAFDPGTDWNVAAIEPDRAQTRYHHDDGAPAWLATIERIQLSC